jgi:hypothetical protein
LWLDILEGVGRGYGFVVKRETPARIDMSWYQAGLLDPMAVVEIETQTDSIWDSEVRNLLYSCASLKILLTYSRIGHQSRLVNGVVNAFGNRRSVGGGEEFLLILMVYEVRKERSWFDHWEGYVVRSQSGEPQLERL